ncbi:lachesin-like [Tachypleus tridentatus]|uniref:lachesin-like n=1 Tax=Tachypleus tridentatus TaxID=6853 RepID=UPI003FD5C631
MSLTTTTFLILRALLYYSVYAQQNPTISFITKEIVVNIGDDVDLECSVEYASQYPVLWAKINYNNPFNNLFVSSDSSKILPDPRYSVVQNTDGTTNTYTLQITKIQEIDAGLYQCQVIIGTNDKIKADVLVYVRIPPVISDNSTRSSITSTGATISLNCYASGYPDPQISWRRENNDLLPSGVAVYRGNVLTIHSITKEDRGTYYCVADNGVGRGARRNIGVEVEFAPYVTIDTHRYGQALQYDMDLQCHVEAFPSPSIVWLKDGLELNDNQHYRISIFATADEFTDSTLRVISIEKRQYGVYICKALNKLGSHQQKIELYETANVICPPACGIDLISSSPSTFHATLPILSLILTILITWKNIFCTNCKSFAYLKCFHKS